MAQKKKATHRTNPALVLLIAALVIFLGIELIQVGQRLSEARQQQAALERQLQMQTQENQALESDLAKKDDEEFIKDLARDQLGLAEEGRAHFLRCERLRTAERPPGTRKHTVLPVSIRLKSTE